MFQLPSKPKEEHVDALAAFSADLARLADLSDDELATLESGIMTAFDTADTSNDEAALADLADALDQVRTEIDRRKPAGDAESPIEDAAAPAAADMMAASAEPVTAAVDTEAEPTVEIATEPEAPAVEATEDNMVEAPADAETPKIPENEEEETPVTSSAVKVPEDRAPVVTEPVVNTITAGADLPGYSAGSPFANLEDFSKSFAKRIDSLSRLRGGDGEKVVVASIASPVSDDRMLKANDPFINRQKIEAVISEQAITASGGFCAPLTTRYDLFSLGVTDRPVRDSLAGFQADRGGIRYFVSPTLNDIAVATGFWDTAKDAAYDPEDDATWKVVASVDCPVEATAETEAVTMALKFGVQSSRVFPENVAVNTALALVQHARVAESTLLFKLKGLSTAIAGQGVKYGAVRDLLITVARAGIWYRDRHRLTKNTPLRAILPEWIVDMLKIDMILQPPASPNRATDLAITDADVQNFFDQWNINITFTPDSAAPSVNGGGFFGDIAAGALPAFPDSMQWALFAEGAFLFLDGGSLDLGVVRDSTLVRANDYMQFSESFEGIAKIGGAALWVTSPVEPLGMYSPAIANTVVTN